MSLDKLSYSYKIVHIYLTNIEEFPVERKIFNINDPFAIKMLKKLRLGFSNPCEHKFGYGFKDTLNPLCSCSIEVETTTHYFLRFHFNNSNRDTRMNDLENLPIFFSTVSDKI